MGSNALDSSVLACNTSFIGRESGFRQCGQGYALTEQLRSDTLFVALTRPQMFAGVTFSFFIINAIVAAELFLIFKSFWVLLAALVIHGMGMIASLREPRIVDLWLTRMRHCPRVKNHAYWQCNSYRA